MAAQKLTFESLEVRLEELYEDAHNANFWGKPRLVEGCLNKIE